MCVQSLWLWCAASPEDVSMTGPTAGISCTRKPTAAASAATIPHPTPPHFYHSSAPLDSSTLATSPDNIPWGFKAFCCLIIQHCEGNCTICGFLLGAAAVCATPITVYLELLMLSPWWPVSKTTSRGRHGNRKKYPMADSTWVLWIPLRFQHFIVYPVQKVNAFSLVIPAIQGGLKTSLVSI